MSRILRGMEERWQEWMMGVGVGWMAWSLIWCNSATIIVLYCREGGGEDTGCNSVRVGSIDSTCSPRGKIIKVYKLLIDAGQIYDNLWPTNGYRATTLLICLKFRTLPLRKEKHEHACFVLNLSLSIGAKSIFKLFVRNSYPILFHTTSPVANK